MKISEIRNMSTDELLTELEDVREGMMKLRFQLATGELTDFNRLRATRQDIARLMTVLTERKQEESN